MTTSGTATYNPVRDKIVYGALRLNGAYSAHNIPRASQVIDAIDALDMMFKAWQMDGLLWLRRFIRVKLVAAQNSYDIGVGSADTIYSGNTGTTAFAQRPLRIYTPTRLDTDGNEVPVELLGRDDWSRLTNKTLTGTIVQVYYDPQMVMGKLYVWLTPASGVTDYIKFSVDRIIEDVGGDEATLDVPPELIETVKYNLGLRLSGEYSPGMSADDKKLAMAMYEKMVGYQQDNTSTFIQPG